jgi:hypothetical protein
MVMPQPEESLNIRLKAIIAIALALLTALAV